MGSRLGSRQQAQRDLAPGRPLRARSWATLLGGAGFAVEILDGPASLDYLVIAVADGGGERVRATS